MFEVELNGRLVAVTLEQMKGMIQQGSLLPSSQIRYNGRIIAASQIPGLNFGPARNGSQPPPQRQASSTPWNTGNPPVYTQGMQGPYQQPQGQVQEGRSYSLFMDILTGSFDSFITVRLIRIVWLFTLIFTAIGFCIMCYTAISENDLTGLVGTIAGTPLSLIFVRICCEVIIVRFKIFEKIRDIHDKLEQK